MLGDIYLSAGGGRLSLDEFSYPDLILADRRIFHSLSGERILGRTGTFDAHKRKSVNRSIGHTRGPVDVFQQNTFGGSQGSIDKIRRATRLR